MLFNYKLNLSQHLIKVLYVIYKRKLPKLAY